MQNPLEVTKIVNNCFFKRTTENLISGVCFGVFEIWDWVAEILFQWRESVMSMNSMESPFQSALHPLIGPGALGGFPSPTTRGPLTFEVLSTLSRDRLGLVGGCWIEWRSNQLKALCESSAKLPGQMNGWFWLESEMEVQSGQRRQDEALWRF